MKLLLFDVDGTLVYAGSGSKRAFEKAFKAFFHVDDPLNGIKHYGLTDPLILQMVAQATLQRSLTPEEAADFHNQYLKYLPIEIERDDSYVVLPGIRHLCEMLSQRDDVVMGLQTGNLSEAAPSKLARGGLDGYFSFGGFGSDSEDRSEVVGVAIERAKGRYPGNEFEPENIFVIGDTPNDIKAGRKNGIKTLAVATGMFSTEDLWAEKPTHVFEDLSDPEAFMHVSGLT